jgi:phage FluMu protein Com
MGIRFACHHCNHALHLKDFQAGKRGKCPACNQSFRIPQHSTDYSIPLEEKGIQNTTTTPAVIAKATETKATAVNVGKAAVGAGAKLANKPETVAAAKRDEKVVVAKRQEIKVRKSEEAASVQAASVTNMTRDESASSQLSASESSSKKDGTVKAFESNPLAQWYVRPPSGGQYGPADAKLLTQWITENRVTADSLIWFDGLTQWTVAGSVLPELFAGSGEAAIVGFGMQPSLGSASESVLEANDAGRLVNTTAINSTAKPIRSRQKQKRNQWILIAILISLCLCLLVGLVAVLMFKK